MVVAFLSWDTERERYRIALRECRVHRGILANNLSLPTSLHSKIIQWGHSYRLVCHLGVRRSAILVATHGQVYQASGFSGFWHQVYQVFSCLIGLSPEQQFQLVVGLLHPLLIPSRPWSHLGTVFITGLPESKGNTILLMVVDRFSKVTHFIPLPKILSSKETAQVGIAMVDHVFWIYGLLVVVVFNMFVSQFWREFCHQIGASMRSSGSLDQWAVWASKPGFETCFPLPGFTTAILCAHNTLPGSDTSMSPFQCSVG